LGAHVNRHSNVTCILDYSLVGSYDGIDPVFFGRIHNPLHFLHLFIINDRIQGEIRFNIVLPAYAGDFHKIVQGEIDR